MNRSVKLGGHLSVRNEAYWIGRVLRYHLEVQEFDIIIVNDDASYDGTREALSLYAQKDPRVVVNYTPKGVGFSQDVFSTAATEVLFDKFQCDVVLPIDADEFWYSEKFSSVKEAVSKLPDEPAVWQTYAYDYVLTSRDPIDEPDPILRYQYCRLHDNPKVAFCRAGGSIQKISLGNHTVILQPKAKLPLYKIPIQYLARFHFRYGDELAFINKILNQVEGFLVGTKGDWLYNPSRYGGDHIWKKYMEIRKRGVSDLYRRQFISEDHLESLLREGKLIRKNPLGGLVPEPPEFITDFFAQCENKAQ